MDYGGIICVRKPVETSYVLSVTTDKCCLKLNAVEVTNTTGDADGKAVTTADDTADIVGMPVVGTKTSHDKGVIVAHVSRAYGAPLGFVTECPKVVNPVGPTRINITENNEKVVEHFETKAPLAGLASGEATKVTEENRVASDTAVCHVEQDRKDLPRQNTIQNPHRSKQHSRPKLRAPLQLALDVQRSPTIIRRSTR